MTSAIDRVRVADRTRLAGVLITVLGIAVTVGQLRPVVRLRQPLAILVAVVFPSLLGLTLIAVGGATIRGDLVEEADALRFAGWVVAGMVIFLFTGLWILLLDVILGYATPFGVALTVNSVALGGVVGVVIGLYDVRTRRYTRELKARERELEDQNRRLDEFASIVSHDLRNPLNVATFRLDVVREDADNEHLAAVADALDRMETIIEDTLALARYGQAVDETETVALGELAERSWRNVETGAADLRVEAETHIRADPDRTRQLFENLFRNAVEHNPDPVTVSVGALTGDGFYVADDGAGIPEAEREQVLEAGYTTNEAGTGLGLAIVGEIADAHGWSVDVTASDAGGARFEVSGVDTDRR